MSIESHGLPGILGEIADLVGIEAALAVAKAVGGGRAYVPRRPGPDHWLVQAMGPEKAAIVADYFTTSRSGMELDFPPGPAGTYRQEQVARAARLRELNDQGLSVKQIARRTGLSRRGVQFFRAREREADDRDDKAPTFDF